MKIKRIKEAQLLGVEILGNIYIFQQNLLKEQIVAMESYNSILIKRLAALGIN